MVMSIIEPFLEKGYYHFMVDNYYYMSVTLFEVLEEKNSRMWDSEVQQICPIKRNLWCERKESQTV